MLRSTREELRRLVLLAIPVVLAELGWMGMGVVDTLMVSRLGDEAVGAVGVGRSVFMGVGVFGIGLLLGLDTVISNAYGAGKRQLCRVALWHGIWIAILIALPLTLLIRLVGAQMQAWGVDPAVLPIIDAYIGPASWAALPIFLYAALRRYLQAVERVAPVLFALISANLVNILVNWMLVFGNLGAPELGVEGAAWATVFSSSYMAIVLAIAVIRHIGGQQWEQPFPWAIQRQMLRRLLSLGIPAGFQLLLEVGVFALATMLAGRLIPAALAAHQITITVASVTYMVPLGISQATAVRVGHKRGAEDIVAARYVGWMGIGFAAGFMALSAIFLVTFARTVLGWFNASDAVIGVAVPLFVAAGVFQVFDGLQVAAIGALRGLGDTRSALIWNAIGYWGVTLPLGYYLCFQRGLGALGLWLGFCCGLAICGVALVRRWHARASLT